MRGEHSRKTLFGTTNNGDVDVDLDREEDGELNGCGDELCSHVNSGSLSVKVWSETMVT